ncbi:hypothetical protein [Streptomyces inhibens]|uniref:hypothetical protein n=1 Tax=Streptomyces inhibens TaxID=2293571 RepID=UPI001EE6C16E|nr:hypothetical protein [Streptomyces inhibens]UKY52833.1 hypothetical protein KI385_31210 [Streptomyces inhibens]
MTNSGPSLAERLAYLGALSLPPEDEAPPQGEVRVQEDRPAGYVDDGSLVSFVAEVKGLARQDVLDSALIAQLAANKAHPREDDVIAWYHKYTEVLEYLCGWVIQGKEFSHWEAHSASFTVDKVIFEVLAAILIGDDLTVAESTVNAIRGLPKEDEKVKIFESESSESHGGNFQIGLCSQMNDAVAMKLGAFYFSAGQEVTNFLWFNFSASDATFYKGTRTMTFNQQAYADVRQDIIEKLGARRKAYLRELEI